MVAFDSQKAYLKNEVKIPVVPPLSVCENQSESSSKLFLMPTVHKSRRARLLIKTDLGQPKQIGFNVNTNVHLKQKKTNDYTHFINELLILILTIYGIVSYLEIQRLKDEVQEIKIQMAILGDSVKLDLEIMNNLFNTLEQETKKLHSEEAKALKHRVTKRDAENLDEVGRDCSNCSSNARIARSVTRGPLALHLKGALPEITVRDGGIISPWYVDKSSSGSFLLTDGIVGERKGVLEIGEEGLYYIYAQIYYLTSSSLNSYAINVQLGDGRGREDSIIAMCSAEAAVSKLSELSCFTATVRYLRRGDRLYITQRERNRRIIFRDNQSFLGLVLLNSHRAVNNK